MALTLEITMSLDGFVAGPDPSLEDPLGKGGMNLHEWAFAAQSWREAHGMTGGEANADSDVIDEQLARTGATIMGRKMFSGGAGPWEDDPNANGWWGDEPPFGHHVFVLTHHPRETLTLGATTFHFVTDGVESALAQARDAAGEKDVIVAGGAQAGQQYLAAGLLDEMQIHVAPILLGDGTRLFDTRRRTSSSCGRSPRRPSRTCATASSADGCGLGVARAGLLALEADPVAVRRVELAELGRHHRHAACRADRRAAVARAERYDHGREVVGSHGRDGSARSDGGAADRRACARAVDRSDS